MAKNNMFDLDDTLLKDDASDINKELELADVLCMREQFDRALSIYNKILDKDMKNEDAYIGILKVHSEYFTKYDSPEIEKDIRIIERMFPDTKNKEYANYCLERKKHVSKPIEKEEKTEAPKSSPKSSEKKTTPKEAIKPTTLKTSKDLEKGMHFVETGQWKRAIETLEYARLADNNILAYYGLGVAYYHKKHNTNAKKYLEFYFHNVIETDKHYKEVCIKLGDLYCGINGRVPDMAKAEFYYEKAATCGEPEGIYRLGDYYYYGWHGFTKNMQKAKGYYTRAAKLGHKGAKHMLNKF